jgi:Rrf2 family protein
MKLSAKTEYACIAMLELAAAYGSAEPVRIGAIAERHGIPPRFLVQILLQLKGAGYVASTRGAAGGYQLIKSPDEISLGAVMTVIDGPDEGPGSSALPQSIAARVLQEAWREVLQVEREMLDGLSFGDLLDRTKEPTEGMYHI